MIKGVKSKIDIKEIRTPSVQIKYPCVILRELNMATPMLISMLEKGNIQLIGERKGESKVIMEIKDSVKNIRKILKNSSVDFYLDKNTVKTITELNDYLEYRLYCI